MQKRVLGCGTIAVACGLTLAGISTAGAQTAGDNLPAPSSAERVSSVPEMRRFQLTPKFLAGFPTGRFGKQVGESPGVAVDFTVRAGRTFVLLGGAFDYLLYGKETRRIALFPTVPEVFGDVNTTNNVVRTHALMRVQPSVGGLRPYAEGLVGFSYVYTRTSIELGNESGGATTTHVGKFAPSFGGGGGVTIGLWAGCDVHLGLDIGFRYLTGGEVDYLTPGTLQRSKSGVAFETIRSRVTLFNAQIGCTVDF